MCKTANEPCVTRCRFGLPLLARELTELAGRWRTYWLRVVYAALLFLLAYLRFADILGGQPAGGFALLGQGRRMFETLVLLEYGGIYLFMPALACSAITYEKERGALGLLFLTRLGPTTILLEKLLSRLVPMFVFLLLALPLLAFTYTLGGVSDFQFYSSVFVLVLTAVHVASITLMCSAYCMTRIAAFLASYALSLGSLWFCSCCGLAFTPGVAGLFIDSPGGLITSAFLLGVSTFICLAMAREYLVNRAFVVPNSLLFRSFPLHEHYELRVDESKAQVVLVRRDRALPKEDPVRWREETKSSLGAPGYLARVVLSIEVPLFLLLLVSLGTVHSGARALLFVVEVILWIVTALLLVVTTTGLFPRERSRQTLGSLLTTPLSGREIILQKLSVVRRLMRALWIPFGTLVLFLFWIWGNGGFTSRDGLQLATTILSVLVYLPLIVWVSLWISLWSKSQGRAILISTAVLVAWVVTPAWLLATSELGRLPAWPRMSSLLGGPSVIFLLNQAGNVTPTTVAVNFLVYGGLLAGIRFVLLHRADVCLGRLSEG